MHKLQKPEPEYEPDHEHGHGHGHEQDYEHEHGNGHGHEHDSERERTPSPSLASELRLHHLSRPDRFRSGYRPSFYAAYARAARRYQFEASKYGSFAYRKNAVVKVRGMFDNATDHEVPAEAIQNACLEYVVPVSIGTPGKQLMLDFDTGSSDLWVWSSEVAGAGKYRAKHRLYHPHLSTTAKRVDGTWKISYGDGSSASGDVWMDHISVAGVHIHGQAIEVAQHLSRAFLTDGGNDGLLGLAFPKLNTVQPHRVATPVENMLEKRLIDPPVFTCKLGHGSEQSFYSFGFIDKSVTRHPIVYHHVDSSRGFWEVASTAYMVGGKPYKSRDNTAIIDTGTTLCLVHDDAVDRIYHRINGARYSNSRGGWIYPNHERLPEIEFAIGHTMYRVRAIDFHYSDAGDGLTFGGIQSRGDLKYDIFGDVFLKSLYVVFDQANMKVGVAQRDD
ncbi:acid protease [Rhodofomes roseus]|uniref:Acid protease n=1 Tax=Rhodofomes roseus TaxID=34475 RepID=A0ABQ8K9A0_9APHY|nr:acid protease [Rhodofomes roseus]KAH9833813.1 acid protease [Rhodofomes roseus]